MEAVKSMAMQMVKQSFTQECLKGGFSLSQADRRTTYLAVAFFTFMAAVVAAVSLPTPDGVIILGIFAIVCLTSLCGAFSGGDSCCWGSSYGSGSRFYLPFFHANSNRCYSTGYQQPYPNYPRPYQREYNTPIYQPRVDSSSMQANGYRMHCPGTGPNFHQRVGA